MTDEFGECNSEIDDNIKWIEAGDADEDDWLRSINNAINTNVQEECDTEALRIEASWELLKEAELDLQRRIEAARNSDDPFVKRMYFGEPINAVIPWRERQRAKRKRSVSLKKDVDDEFKKLFNHPPEKKASTEANRLISTTCKYDGCGGSVQKRASGEYTCTYGCVNAPSYEYYEPIVDEDDSETVRDSKAPHISKETKDELREELLGVVADVPRICNIEHDQRIVEATITMLERLMNVHETIPVEISNLAKLLIVDYHKKQFQRKCIRETMKMKAAATAKAKSKGKIKSGDDDDELVGSSNAPVVRVHEALASLALYTASCVHGRYLPAHYTCTPSKYLVDEFWKQMKSEWGWANITGYYAKAIEVNDCIKVIIDSDTCTLPKEQRINIRRLSYFMMYAIVTIGQLFNVHRFHATSATGCGDGGDNDDTKQKYRLNFRREWITKFTMSCSGFGLDDTEIPWSKLVCPRVLSLMKTAKSGINSMREPMPEYWSRFLSRHGSTIATAITSLVACLRPPVRIALLPPPLEIEPLPSPTMLRFVPLLTAQIDSKAPIMSPTPPPSSSSPRDSYSRRHAHTMAIIDSKQRLNDDLHNRKDLHLKKEELGGMIPLAKQYSGVNNHSHIMATNEIIMIHEFITDNGRQTITRCTSTKGTRR